MKTTQFLHYGFQPPAQKMRCICLTSTVWPRDEAAVMSDTCACSQNLTVCSTGLTLPFWLTRHKSFTEIRRASGRQARRVHEAGQDWLRLGQTRAEPQLCPSLVGKTSWEALNLFHFGETWTITAPSSQGWRGEDLT